MPGKLSKLRRAWEELLLLELRTENEVESRLNDARQLLKNCRDAGAYVGDPEDRAGLHLLADQIASFVEEVSGELVPSVICSYEGEQRRQKGGLAVAARSESGGFGVDRSLAHEADTRAGLISAPTATYFPTGLSPMVKWVSGRSRLPDAAAMLRAFQRRWLACTFLGGVSGLVCGALFFVFFPPIYESQSLVLRLPSANVQQSAGDSDALAEEVAAAVLEEAAKTETDLRSWRSAVLGDRFSVSRGGGENALLFTLQSTDPQAVEKELSQLVSFYCANRNQTLLRELDSAVHAMESNLEENAVAIRQLQSGLPNSRERGEINNESVAKRTARLELLRAVETKLRNRIADMKTMRSEEAAAARTRVTGEATEAVVASGEHRALISSIVGLTTAACITLAVVFAESLRKILSRSAEVDEGLGIRVIGTLPALSARSKLNPSHPVVAQLTEGIDSIRTALMHEAVSRRRQIVLVTSPSTLEGRTTLASQLAASLARTGRRTLLIDGDLRRPALHVLFDQPLEDGLCEVLRSEADVADVLRPTHAEGLWLMTAGYCDADAIHALAADQMQPIFEKLRSEYDFVIIDSAPVLGLSDSLQLGQHCDGAVLSVLRDHTGLPKIQQAADLLRSVGVRLIGSVINGVPGTADRRVTALQSVASKNERDILGERAR